MAKKIKQQAFYSKSIPLHKLFPSIITIFALCIGVTAIRYAMQGQFPTAAFFLILACLLDMLDGQVARMLNATSQFGAHLDSLADVINFGISPAITVYLWQISAVDQSNYLWLAMLIYVTCGTLRLARFNIQALGTSPITEEDITDQNQNSKSITQNGDTYANMSREHKYRKEYLKIIHSGKFSNGVPITVAAILIMFPMIITFGLYKELNFHNTTIGLYVISISASMVMSIPTFTTKPIRVNRRYLPWTFLSLAALAGLMVIEPWNLISAISVIYIISIPASYIQCNKILKSTIEENKKMNQSI